jgi:hypothetical protein
MTVNSTGGAQHIQLTTSMRCKRSKPITARVRATLLKGLLYHLPEWFPISGAFPCYTFMPSATCPRHQRRCRRRHFPASRHWQRQRLLQEQCQRAPAYRASALSVVATTLCQTRGPAHGFSCVRLQTACQWPVRMHSTTFSKCAHNAQRGRIQFMPILLMFGPVCGHTCSRHLRPGFLVCAHACIRVVIHARAQYYIHRVHTQCTAASHPIQCQ